MVIYDGDANAQKEVLNEDVDVVAMLLKSVTFNAQETFEDNL